MSLTLPLVWFYLGTPATDDMIVIYVNDILIPPPAEWAAFATPETPFSAFQDPHPAAHYFNVVMGADDRDLATLAHELMHNLLDSVHTEDNTQQFVFHASELGFHNVNTRRRITETQEGTIHGSDLVVDP